MYVKMGRGEFVAKPKREGHKTNILIVASISLPELLDQKQSEVVCLPSRPRYPKDFKGKPKGDPPVHVATKPTRRPLLKENGLPRPPPHPSQVPCRMGWDG